ncbi:hypothetical protein BX600DRAFT_459601 [Xylariales sp. PMI_506]|nr:hypothetical protein BX600DRAFT_459601 [Xylariales sp. PMI_506]
MTSTITQRKIENSTTGEAAEYGRYGRYYQPVEDADEMKKIIAESCSMSAGTAAVLLQIASKGVGKGVSDHSSFTKRPVERARRSLVYIYVMAFGTLEERRKVTDATHRAHSQVKGADYDANDVDLQIWVAATMYWSLVLGYEQTYGKLNEATADKVYREFSVYATGLRVPPERWPKDRQAFQEYWEKAIASLEVTDEAKAVAQDVLFPGQNLPWPAWIYAKISGPSTRITTTELLPERIRNEFGIPSTLYSRSMYRLISMWNRVIYPIIPQSIRHFPKDHYMADFRSRLARGSRL